MYVCVCVNRPNIHTHIRSPNAVDFVASLEHVHFPSPPEPCCHTADDRQTGADKDLIWCECASASAINTHTCSLRCVQSAQRDATKRFTLASVGFCVVVDVVVANACAHELCAALSRTRAVTT